MYSSCSFDKNNFKFIILNINDLFEIFSIRQPNLSGIDNDTRYRRSSDYPRCAAHFFAPYRRIMRTEYFVNFIAIYLLSC